MKKRTGDPWMPAPTYGRTLSGLTVNLVVRDVARAVDFARVVLAAEIVYADPDFAVLRHGVQFLCGQPKFLGGLFQTEKLLCHDHAPGQRCDDWADWFPTNPPPSRF